MKTTEDNFIFFKSECDFWLNTLGLISWKVYYKHENCEDVLADTSTTFTGRVATIRLNKVWKAPITQDALCETALHEVLEVLLSPLYVNAQSRVWSDDEYLKEHHAVIRVLEKLLRKTRL